MSVNNIIAGSSIVLKCAVDNKGVPLPEDFTACAEIYTYNSTASNAEAVKLPDFVVATRVGDNTFEFDISPIMTDKFTDKTNVLITVESGDKSHIIKKIVRFKVERF